MADVLVRPFTALVAYPGKKPFMVGTFFVEGRTAKDHEMEAIVLQEVSKFWAEHLPDGTPLPRIEKHLWGAVLFVPEEDWHARAAA